MKMPIHNIFSLSLTVQNWVTDENYTREKTVMLHHKKDMWVKLTLQDKIGHVKLASGKEKQQLKNTFPWKLYSTVTSSIKKW